MDRVEVLPHCKRSWEQNKMEGEGCNVCGTPTVIYYGDRCRCRCISTPLLATPLNNGMLHTFFSAILWSKHYSYFFTSFCRPSVFRQIADFANVFKAFLGTNWIGLPFAFKESGVVVSEMQWIEVYKIQFNLLSIRLTVHFSHKYMKCSS